MDSSIISALIGGAIATAPSIITGILSLYSQHQQAKRDIAMKQVDLIDVPRIADLREYAYQLGAFVSNASICDLSDFSENKFMAAHARAAAFVFPETLQAMNAAYPVIMAGWNVSNDDMSVSQKLQSSEITNLLKCINAEMTLKGFEKPANRDHYIHFKRHIHQHKR